MDTDGDAVNLADEEIVKNTPFFSDDYEGSQVPSTVEPHFVYGSSERCASGQSPYISYATMQPTQGHQSQDSKRGSVSQVSFGQQNAWPNYGPGYGLGVHPMQQLFESGMYPAFPTSNFVLGMPAGYVGPSRGGPGDKFIFSQVGHGGCGNPNAEWLKLQKMNTPVHEFIRVPPVFAQSEGPQPPHPLSAREGASTLEPRPLSARLAASTGGPWFCPRSKRREHEHTEQSTGEEKHFFSIEEGVGGNNGNKNVNVVGPQASELRHSPPPESAETQQGPRRSGSVDPQRGVRVADDQGERSHGTTPYQSPIGLQRHRKNTSKSNTPDSLNQRKGQREDEKSYLKEVKVAISQGRVPQVKVVQDDSGYIVRYRSQFFNALKLAAHAIVQDAYIDVSKSDTMNEIMEEVKMQFIVPEPLPAGMVELYLKGYFKGLRLQYHQFWIENGDKKKPDGCRQAAWLQLVEFWKSPEGSKECKKNQRNALADRSNLTMGKEKQKCGMESCVEGNEVGDVQMMGSMPPSGASDSLGFDHLTPMPKSTLFPRVATDAMADISLQLHDAVDSILSSFAAERGSLPSSNIKTRDIRPPLQGRGSLSVKRATNINRTSAQVLGSLQQPVLQVSKNDSARYFVPNVGGHCQFPGKENYSSMTGSTHIGAKESQSTYAPKVSVNMSLGRGKSLFPVNVADDQDMSQMKHVAVKSAGVLQEETMFLSSDASFDGVELSPRKRTQDSRLENMVKKTNEVYTEEMEAWPRLPTQTDGIVNGSDRKIQIKKGENRKSGHVGAQYLSKSHKKVVVEGEKSSDCHGRQERSKGDCSKNPVLLFREKEVEVNSDTENRSEEDVEEYGGLNEDFPVSSDEEEPPVLPREIVKRKLDVDNGGNSGNKEVKGKSSKKSKTPLKKPKVIEIDKSILKKLEFFKRPKNLNPIKTRSRVWVLHPKHVGKVVAEAIVGVNRKSRCVDSANEICKEGQQFISVVRFLYKNMPVIYDADGRFPKHISYLDQAEGLPHTPVLWCICHLIEIPPLDQITRFMGNLMQPFSQETMNNDTDFEDNRRKGKPKSREPTAKDPRMARVGNATSMTGQVSKGSRTVLRSAKA